MVSFLACVKAILIESGINFPTHHDFSDAKTKYYVYATQGYCVLIG